MEDKIKQLTEMGFDRDLALDALKNGGGQRRQRRRDLTAHSGSGPCGPLRVFMSSRKVLDSESSQVDTLWRSCVEFLAQLLDSSRCIWQQRMPRSRACALQDELAQSSEHPRGVQRERERRGLGRGHAEPRAGALLDLSREGLGTCKCNR